MTTRIIVGHALDELRKLLDESVQCCIVSPPYYGLRSYGVKAQVWGGVRDCAHEWGADVVDRNRATPRTAGSGLTNNGEFQAKAMRFEKRSAFCRHCGAWRGHLGLEPDYRLYIEHIVEIFREVFRVLRTDGTLWLNMGDCYATEAGRVGRHPGGGPIGNGGQRWSGLEPESRGYRGDRLANGRSDQTAVMRRKTRADRDETYGGKHTAITAMGPMTQPNRMPQPGLPGKSLMGIPWRVAFALQDAGWILRRDIVWHKPAPMPESVWDRPTTAHEYIFLLVKNNRTIMWVHRDRGFAHRVYEKPAPDWRWTHRTTGEVSTKPRGGKAWKRVNLWRGFDYYYDAQAIMEASSADSHARAARNRSDVHKYADGGPGNQTIAREQPVAGRYMPVPAGWDTGEGAHGTIHRNGRRPPTVVGVGHNERPRKGVANGAASRAPGVNPKAVAYDNPDGPRPRQNDSFSAACVDLVAMRNKRSVWTVASEPFPEAHFATFPPALIEPCVLAGCPAGGMVLDLFFGAGTTGVVCERHQRDCVGIELNPDYAAMAERRIKGDADRQLGPLFADPQMVQVQAELFGEPAVT